jgi:hypothetical protein
MPVPIVVGQLDGTAFVFNMDYSEVSRFTRKPVLMDRRWRSYRLYEPQAYAGRLFLIHGSYSAQPLANVFAGLGRGHVEVSEGAQDSLLILIPEKMIDLGPAPEGAKR